MSEGDFVDTKKVAWGAICTSSKHLLAPLRQLYIAWTYRFDLASRQVRRRCNIGRCICDRGKEDDENHCDVSTTHRALNSLIGININEILLF
jgi:hypothetical protein